MAMPMAPLFESELVLEPFFSLPRELQTDSPRTSNNNQFCQEVVDSVFTSGNYQLFVTSSENLATDTTQVSYSSGRCSHNDNFPFLDRQVVYFKKLDAFSRSVCAGGQF